MAQFIKLSGVNDVSRYGNGEPYSILINVDNIVNVVRDSTDTYSMIGTVNNTVLRVTEDLDTIAKYCSVNNKLLTW